MWFWGAVSGWSALGDRLLLVVLAAEGLEVVEGVVVTWGDVVAFQGASGWIVVWAAIAIWVMVGALVGVAA